MSENTKIQWCDHTFNPWIGCAKVSSGCANCYAENLMATRYGRVKWGKGQPRSRTSAANWKLPLKWNARPWICSSCGWSDTDALKEGRWHRCPNCPDDRQHFHKARVFCASLADWLDDEVPIEWLTDLLFLIYKTPNLDWLLLSKRPENFLPRVTEAQTKRSGIIEKAKGYSELAMFAAWLEFWRTGAEVPGNVWIGTSVEDQQRADERIPHLLKIPARVRFLSVEPMLEPISLTGFDHLISWERATIRWVIFGGESGKCARPCHLEWISEGVRQCRAAGIAPFVKQLGADCRTNNLNLYDLPESTDFEPSGCMEGPAPCGILLKDKKGGDMEEWPEELCVRKFPSSK